MCDAITMFETPASGIKALNSAFVTDTGEIVKW